MDYLLIKITDTIFELIVTTSALSKQDINYITNNRSVKVTSFNNTNDIKLYFETNFADKLGLGDSENIAFTEFIQTTPNWLAIQRAVTKDDVTARYMLSYIVTNAKVFLPDNEQVFEGSIISLLTSLEINL